MRAIGPLPVLVLTALLPAGAHAADAAVAAEPDDLEARRKLLTLRTAAVFRFR